MKKILFLIVFISNFSLAQNPWMKQWDYRFGGTADERLTCFQQTSDGGYILGGRSNSNISGDKTQDTWGTFDYWIIKIDSLGIKQWDKDFGGTDDDQLYSLQQTADGGYILGGRSGSDISGDKTQDTWGTYDYWIIKVDSSGIKQWDKDFGGTNDDELYSLKQTTDGGYILGGWSYSDISGDKTQDNWDPADTSSDYWIVKIDALGNYQWDKAFGGTDHDELYSLRQTIDGGYILGGLSYSNSSGNKTQDSWGSHDYWIVKTDSLGNMQWNKDYGGTDRDALYSVQQTNDGGYILAGYSYSGISGNKTQALWGGIAGDYWIVKTDSSGNYQWDKDYGGTDNEDEFGNISQTPDRGYLIAGTSYSSISGDKTENNLADEQAWILKTDSFGNKLWDKTIFTTGHDESGYITQTKDGCYAIANWTNSDTGGYKTQPRWNNSYDFWIIKFCFQNIALNVSDSTLCEKFCINFYDQSINNPTSWEWQFPGGDPSFSILQNPTAICYNSPGTYDVTLITTNANGNDTLTLPDYITVYPTPPIPTITQVGYMLTSSAASSYQWQLNSANIPGATNQSYTILQTGYYTVIVGDSNDCKNSTALYVLISGVDEVNNDVNLFIYPNPSSGNFLVELLNGFIAGEISIDVVNVIGQQVFSSSESRYIGNSSPFKKEIDLSDIARGVYFIEIKTEKEFMRKKILIAE